jgi:hypothetical protein
VRINEDHSALWYYRLNLRGATDFHLFQLYFHNPSSSSGAAAPTVYHRHVRLARDASGAPFLVDDQPNYPNDGYCTWRDEDQTAIQRPSGFGPMLTADWEPSPSRTPSLSKTPSPSNTRSISQAPSASKTPVRSESLRQTRSPSRNRPRSESLRQTRAETTPPVSDLPVTDEEVADEEVADETISPDVALEPPPEDSDVTPVIAFAVVATGAVGMICLVAYLIHRATSFGLP